MKVLFCLCNLGGIASSYSNWEIMSNKDIKIIAIEYAGHGSRSDNYYENFNEALDDIYNIIKKECNFKEYSIFGHSMGALLAYNLYQYIKSKNDELPENLFLAGATPPKSHLATGCKLLCNKIVIMATIKLYNIPLAVLLNKETRNMVINNIYADKKILTTYKYKENDKIKSKGIYILIGNRDFLNRFTYKKWDMYSDTKPIIKFFKGNHFFVRNTEVREYVLDKLCTKQ